MIIRCLVENESQSILPPSFPRFFETEDTSSIIQRTRPTSMGAKMVKREDGFALCGIVLGVVLLLGPCQVVAACVTVADVSKIQPGMHVCALRVTGTLDASKVDLTDVTIDSIQASGSIRFGNTTNLTILGAVNAGEDLSFGMTKGFEAQEVSGAPVLFLGALRDCQVRRVISKSRIDFVDAVVGSKFDRIQANLDLSGDVSFFNDVNGTTIGIISSVAKMYWDYRVCFLICSNF